MNRRTLAMNLKMKGVLMVVLAASFWGLLSTFAQILMQNENLEPSWLLTIRLLGSGILLLIWALMKKIPIWDI
jgi:drug/metabolite transporter (DMT)-like permease